MSTVCHCADGYYGDGCGKFMSYCGNNNIKPLQMCKYISTIISTKHPEWQ